MAAFGERRPVRQSGVTKSSAGAEDRVQVSVICEAPPLKPGFVFGLQDKSGSLHDGVEERDGSLRFEGEIRAVSLADGTVGLRGPIVHGRPGAFFLYLSCRPDGDPNAPWAFRVKVPLDGVDGSAAAVQGRIRPSGGGTARLLGDGWTDTAAT
jgi:hypothetical protein